MCYDFRGVIYMDVIEALTTLITNVGFPIACCIVLFLQNNKQRESMDELKITIEKNSTILDKVFDKLDRMDGEAK